MSNVWGDESVNGGGEDEGIDSFRIQNELAHTMSSIFKTTGAGLSSFDDNPFKDHREEEEDEEEVKENEEEEDDDDEDQHSDEHESAHDAYAGEINNEWEQGQIKAKQSHLLSTLTQSSTDNGFLKSPETNDIEDVLTSNRGGDTAVDELMQFVDTESPLKETIETKRSITSPNRKIQMLRPRRVPLSSSKISDPLSAGPSLRSDSKDSLLDSPGTRKSKFISSIDAPLFNINKDDILKNARELPQNEATKSIGVSGHTSEGGGDVEYIEDNENLVKFDIIVGDPMTVGDFPNAHTIYTITTKTQLDLLDHEETVVTRRYKDFLWLYHKLLNNHPGFIIPPPPEKQMVNRFDCKFIENRRMGLEQMLQKIANRVELQKDSDWILFLQSNDFAHDSAKSEDGSPIGLTDDNFNVDTMADMVNSMVIAGETPASSSGGFFSSLIGGLQAPKYVETDEFLLEKQEYIKALDEQLRQLSRSLDMILEKRDELQLSLDELIVVIGQMSDLEVNSDITLIMSNFEELQQSLRELLERSNMSQILTFGSVIDEYIRIIGSIRNCFENRTKICNNVVTLEQTLEKKQRSVEKLKTKNQGDKLDGALKDLDRVQLLLNKQRKFQDQFNKNFKRDLGRFEFEKVRDIKNMIEIYWEGLIENQKHLIELWEIFYDKCHFQNS